MHVPDPALPKVLSATPTQPYLPAPKLPSSICCRTHPVSHLGMAAATIGPGHHTAQQFPQSAGRSLSDTNSPFTLCQTFLWPLGLLVKMEHPGTSCVIYPNTLLAFPHSLTPAPKRLDTHPHAPSPLTMSFSPTLASTSRASFPPDQDPQCGAALPVSGQPADAARAHRPRTQNTAPHLMGVSWVCCIH